MFVKLQHMLIYKHLINIQVKQVFCSRNALYVYSNVTAPERIQTIHKCINLCFLELENENINVMIINKDLKNNDKDISHEYKWGVTSWGTIKPM